jgi:AraC family transcriptional regulator
MRRLELTTLHTGPLVRVADVACAAPRSPCGATEHNAAPELILPRRGVFSVHRHRATAVADAASAVVLRAGEEYRVSHPAGHGDACTTLAFAPDLVEEALGALPPADGTLRPATQRRVALLTARLRRGAGALEADEGALLLLDAVAGDLRDRAPVAPATSRRADAVRALLASDPAADWRLASVAAAVHCSPFHLARQFRTATGETIARYVMRLRLAVAAERVAGGERDLAPLAHELGFSHHSHFSARFRALFALAPSELRTIVTEGAPARP